MRILHIINNLGSGGAEKLIEEALPIMKRDGEDVEVLLLSDNNNVFDESLKNNKVKVTVLSNTRKLISIVNIYFIRKHIIKGKYDIIHTHLFPTNYLTPIAVNTIFRNKPKLITTEHSTHNRRREKKLYKLIERYIYSIYDKVISISDDTHNNLVNWLGIKGHDLNKFIVIGNGVNLTRYGKAEPYKKSQINPTFDDETILLCMVGRFSKQKDQLTLIKAMKGLQNNVHLLLIGEGPLKDTIQKEVQVNSLENNVHFLGFRNDIEEIFKSVEVIILSSNWEGFGLAAVEGMASGKPVIASDVPGLSKVVKHAGILFEKGNSLELQISIKQLIHNKEEYEIVARKCLARSKDYDIDKMVRKYLNHYKALNKS